MGVVPTHYDAGQEPARAPREAALIVNARSRRGQQWFEMSKECLSAQGVRLVAAHAVEEPSTLSDVVRDAMRQGAPMVVVGGGDGTFRCVAGVLAGTPTVLGVLPLGTVNDFARNLGIAPTVEAACEVIAGGRVACIDVGRANDESFVITASIGFSAIMQHALTPGLKRCLGPFAYLAASLLAWRQARRLRITLTGDHPSEEMTVMQAGVINGHTWMAGRVEIPGVDLESGRLAFYALPPQDNLSYFRIARRLRHGEFFRIPGLRAFTTRDLTITTRKPQHLVLDGDMCGVTPVRFTILPDALQVCVPEGFEKGVAPPGPSV